MPSDDRTSSDDESATPLDVAAGSGALRHRVETLSRLIALPASTDDARDARCSARIHRARLLLTEALAFQTRDARASELQPLFGSDPDTLCQMALSDASEALAHAPGNRDAHMLRLKAAQHLGTARADVRRFAVEALSFLPGDSEVLEALGSDPLRKTAAAAATNDDEEEGAEELDCVLCMKLLYAPVTTPCGHSFCRHCLAAALDHSTSRQQCPLCRAPLHMAAAADHPPTVALQAIIQRLFPERYAERAVEVRGLLNTTNGEGGNTTTTIVVPLFVVGALFPGHATRFNIFEPRYRLMMRRCLEGSRVFGVLSHVDDEESAATVGTLARITDCRMQPDGRLVMAVEGERRFRICRVWEMDGYRVAEVAPISDAPITDDEGHAGVDNDDDEARQQDPRPQPAAERPASLEAAAELAATLNAAIRQQLPAEAARRIPTLSEPPTAAELERLSLWACALCGGGAEQLASTDTFARLQFCADRILGRQQPRCTPM